MIGRKMDRKFDAVLERLPPILRIILLLWFGLGVAFLTIDELNENLPTWFVIVLTLPYAGFAIYVGIYMDLLGLRAVTSALRNRGHSVGSDPVAQYKAGEISHPAMMEELGRRNLADMQGCRIIFALIGFTVLGVVGLFPRNSDNSIKAEYVTPALGALGLASLYLLFRGIANRAVRWACYLFLGLSAIGVPLGLLAIFNR